MKPRERWKYSMVRAALRMMRRRKTLRGKLGTLLRTIADRVDHHGAPKAIGWSFTFELGKGMVFHDGRGHGCPLWYLGDDDYELAHDLAENHVPRIDWKRLAEQ